MGAWNGKKWSYRGEEVKPGKDGAWKGDKDRERKSGQKRKEKREGVDLSLILISNVGGQKLPE